MIKIKNQTMFFMMRSSITIISAIVFVLIFIELIKALGYGWADSEYTWFYIFGFGCIISFLFLVLILFRFIDYCERYMEKSVT